MVDFREVYFVVFSDLTVMHVGNGIGDLKHSGQTYPLGRH